MHMHTSYSNMYARYITYSNTTNLEERDGQNERVLGF